MGTLGGGLSFGLGLGLARAYVSSENDSSLPSGCCSGSGSGSGSGLSASDDDQTVVGTDETVDMIVMRYMMSAHESPKGRRWPHGWSSCCCCMSALARSHRAFPPSRFLAGILAVRTRLASSASLLAAEAAEASLLGDPSSESLGEPCSDPLGDP